MILKTKEDIFIAFRLTSFNKTKIVIMWEAPYPSSAAHGLNFSVNPRANVMSIPPCIQNIFNEL